MNVREIPSDVVALRKTRHALGFSVRQFAGWLEMQGSHAERNVRRWEKGTHKIPKWVKDKILFIPLEIKE